MVHELKGVPAYVHALGMIPFERQQGRRCTRYVLAGTCADCVGSEGARLIDVRGRWFRPFFFSIQRQSGGAAELSGAGALLVGRLRAC